MERKTFYLRQLFLMSQNWQNCMKDLVLSHELFVEELYNTEVHFNLSGEICSGRLLLPIPDSYDKTSVE